MAKLNEMLDVHEARLRSSGDETYWQSANSDFHVAVTTMARNEHLFDVL